MVNKVTKELFIALNKSLKIGSKEELLKDHVSTGKWKDEDFLIFNQLSPIDMAEILVNGYELEETPEQKLKLLWDKQWEAYNLIKDYQNLPGGSFEDGVARGIALTLETLNIKIKGINE